MKRKRVEKYERIDSQRFLQLSRNGQNKNRKLRVTHVGVKKGLQKCQIAKVFDD